MKVITPSSKLVLKYLALPHSIGGRGGALRYFLLTQEIPFEEKLFAMGDEWATEKKRLVESGENPCAAVPIIEVVSSKNANDITILPQHIATARLLAKVYQRTSGDVYQDYVQDLVADEYQGFRDKWVQIALVSTSDKEKEDYCKIEQPQLLAKFNALYQQFKTHEIFLSVDATNGKPLWGDAALFGLLRDLTLTGQLTLDELNEYPALMAMYRAFEKIPAVAEWIEKTLAAK